MGLETALFGGLGLSAIGALGGGMAASGGAKDAANAAAGAQDRAVQAQMQMFNTVLGLQSPYRTAGFQALESLMRELYGSDYTMGLSFDPASGMWKTPQETYRAGSTRTATGGTTSRTATTSPLYGIFERLSSPLGRTGGTGWTVPSLDGSRMTRPLGLPGDQPIPVDAQMWNRWNRTGTGTTPSSPYSLNTPQLATTTSPLYSLQKELGETDINRALAARGLYNSGPGVGMLSDFYRKLAATEAARKEALLSTVAGFGTNAAGTGSNAAMNVGSSLANTYMQGGGLQANALLQAGNARAGMFQNLASIPQGYMQYMMLQNLLK